MSSSSGESLSTLQFVQRAKHIKNKAKANEVEMDAQSLHLEVASLRSVVETMKTGDLSLTKSSPTKDSRTAAEQKHLVKRCLSWDPVDLR